MKLLRKKLKNGMTVIMEKRDLPVVSFCITNKLGGIFESSDIKGICHVIEHMVFTGTKTRTHEDISREIEKGGILNAFTANEITSFWFKLPSDYIFNGIEIITDMLNNPTFDPEKFGKEKKVILEEIKMYHDNPRARVMEMIESNLYGSPFGDLVIGSVETVSKLNRDFVADYFKKMYCPSNYISVIVGNANFNKICKMLEKSFSKKKFNSKPIEIKLINRGTVEKRKDLDQAHFVFAIHAPLEEKKFLALQLLNMHLAHGMSSKLFLKIREEKGLAYNVKGDLTREKNYAYYSIYVGTRKEAIPEIKEIILNEFKCAQNMTQEELDEAKMRFIGLKKLSCEESSDVMNDLLFTENINGKAEEYYKLEEKIKKITLSQVRDSAKISSYSSASIIPD